MDTNKKIKQDAMIVAKAMEIIKINEMIVVMGIKILQDKTRIKAVNEYIANNKEEVNLWLSS